MPVQCPGLFPPIILYHPGKKPVSNTAVFIIMLLNIYCQLWQCKSVIYVRQHIKCKAPTCTFLVCTFLVCDVQWDNEEVIAKQSRLHWWTENRSWKQLQQSHSIFTAISSVCITCELTTEQILHIYWRDRAVIQYTYICTPTDAITTIPSKLT